MIGIGCDNICVSKKDLKYVDISYLPKCTAFLKQILENKNLFSNIG